MMKSYFFTLGLIFISFLSAQNLKDHSATHLPEAIRQPLNSMDANVADIDRDGDLDIVIAIEFRKNIVLLNDGKGNFSDGSNLLPDKTEKISPKPYPYYPHHDSEDVMVEDINKDGLLDILFVTEDDKTNELYLQNTDGSFSDASDQFPVDNISNALIKGDFDGDGWVDMIVGNKGQNNYLANKKGKLVDETTARMPIIEDTTQDLEVGDYDNDGDLDLLIGNEEDNKLLQNNGKGIFMDVSDKVFSSGISEETREADFADVDNDGDLDIYFSNVRMFTPKNPVQRLLINDNGKFIDKSDAQLSLNNVVGAIDADFFDIDEDGDQDLLIGQLNGLTIALNNGKGFFKDETSKFIVPTNVPIVDVEVADFNGDHKPDIYLACFRTPDLLLLSGSN